MQGLWRKVSWLSFGRNKMRHGRRPRASANEACQHGAEKVASSVWASAIYLGPGGPLVRN